MRIDQDALSTIANDLSEALSVVGARDYTNTDAEQQIISLVLTADARPSVAVIELIQKLGEFLSRPYQAVRPNDFSSRLTGSVAPPACIKRSEAPHEGAATVLFSSEDRPEGEWLTYHLVSPARHEIATGGFSVRMLEAP